MCVCVCVHACGCTHVLNITYVCLGVCMSVEEAGAAERGRECESETKIIFYVFILFIYFTCSFLSRCVSFVFKYLLCIILNNVS